MRYLTKFSVVHIATEDRSTVLHLIATNCMPILLYGLDVCPLNVADKRSLDFVQTRLLMKLFKTSSTDIIQQLMPCYVCCHCVKSVSDLIWNRRRNFLTKFVNNCDNVVCSAISIMANVNSFL